MKKTVGWLISLSIIIFSCDIFKPRKPEPGDGDGEFSPPVCPGVVIINLILSYNSRNIETYGECFDQENFRFYADPEDTTGPYKEYLRNWDFGAEDSVTQSIFNSVSDTIRYPPIILQFTPVSRDSTDTTAIFYEAYELRLGFPEPLYQYAKGKVKFDLVKVENFWYIRTWTDFKEDTTDWGEIKASFRR